MYSNLFLIFFAIFSLALAIPQNRNGNNGGQGGNNDNGGNGGNTGGNNGGTTLNAANIQKASDSNGNPDQAEGQSASATDPANFINFCNGKQITNGAQLTGGSCNGIVMGDIPSKGNMISSIIINPAPGQNIQANTNFDIEVQISNLVAGKFTNPDNTYYAAPQALQGGKVVGHCHVTVQNLGNSLTPNQPPDAATFAFFKGINDAGNGNGLLKATVTGGLPAGNYRVCTMNSASNHQPVLMPVAQRGAQDDCTKFTVGGNGGNSGNGQGGNTGNGGNKGQVGGGQGGSNGNANGGNGNTSTGTGNANGGNGNGNGNGSANGGNRGNDGRTNAGPADAGTDGTTGRQQSGQASAASSSVRASSTTNTNGGRQQGSQASTATASTAATSSAMRHDGTGGSNGQRNQSSATTTRVSAQATASSGLNGNADNNGGRFMSHDRRHRFESRGYIAV